MRFNDLIVTLQSEIDFKQHGYIVRKLEIKDDKVRYNHIDKTILIKVIILYSTYIHEIYL